MSLEVRGSLDPPESAKIRVRKNSGVDVGRRPRLNLIEGSNLSLLVNDDITNDEIDITLSASASGTGEPHQTADYLLFEDVGVLKARNNNTGNIDYNSTTLGSYEAVLEAVIADIETAGGNKTIECRGRYNFNDGDGVVTITKSGINLIYKGFFFHEVLIDSSDNLYKIRKLRFIRCGFQPKATVGQQGFIVKGSGSGSGVGYNDWITLEDCYILHDSCATDMGAITTIDAGALIMYVHNLNYYSAITGAYNFWVCKGSTNHAYNHVEITGGLLATFHGTATIFKHIEGHMNINFHDVGFEVGGDATTLMVASATAEARSLNIDMHDLFIRCQTDATFQVVNVTSSVVRYSHVFFKDITFDYWGTVYISIGTFNEGSLNLHLEDAYPLTPVGIIATPFDNTPSYGIISICHPSGASTPVTAKTYFVRQRDVYVKSTGGTGVYIKLKAPDNTTLEDIGASVSGKLVKKGHGITFGGFSVAPTVLISFA